MGFNFKKCTLSDLQELSDILEYSCSNKILHDLDVVKIDQLSWVLKKNNKHVNVLSLKIKYLEDFLSDRFNGICYNSTLNNPSNDDELSKQVCAVFDSSFLDLPLLINSVKVPIAKDFLSWRFKIRK